MKTVGLLVFGLLLNATTTAAETGSNRAWLSRVLAAHKIEDGRVGLVVLDEKGRVRASLHADRPFTPASNQKILVVAAALWKLGADFQYETSLWADRAPRGGVLEGDLVVTGSGDPNISGRFTGGDPTATFRSWARNLTKNGLRRVRGDLLIDDFLFDDERFLPTWEKRYLSRWYAAQIGALNFNDNCLDFVLFPDDVGSLVRFEISPSTEFVKVENTCRTTASGEIKYGLDRVAGGNRIRLWGKVPVKYKKGTKAYHVTVNDPGLFFGTVLKETFAREGLAIEGRVVRDRQRVPSRTERVPIHVHRSPLAKDLAVILRNSQNLHAEVLLKAVGASGGEAGSVASGRRQVLRFLREIGAGTEDVEIVDGSGLSAKNRVSPAAIARVLRWVSGQPYFDLFRDSLAVGGESGTLSKRFLRSPARGAVTAKTGYIGSVSALSGYVTVQRPAGDLRWSFSIITNGYRSLNVARKFEEDLVEEIHRRMGAGGLETRP